MLLYTVDTWASGTLTKGLQTKLLRCLLTKVLSEEKVQFYSLFGLPYYFRKGLFLVLLFETNYASAKSFFYVKFYFRMVQRGRGQEVDFIFEEILFDLREISKLIGCSVDDAYMLMHLVFNGMRTTQVRNVDDSVKKCPLISN